MNIMVMVLLQGNGCTVLHAAAESGNEEVIQLFLPNAAEIIDIVNKVLPS